MLSWVHTVAFSKDNTTKRNLAKKKIELKRTKERKHNLEKEHAFCLLQAFEVDSVPSSGAFPGF